MISSYGFKTIRQSWPKIELTIIVGLFFWSYSAWTVTVLKKLGFKHLLLRVPGEGKFRNAIDHTYIIVGYYSFFLHWLLTVHFFCFFETICPQISSLSTLNMWVQALADGFFSDLTWLGLLVLLAESLVVLSGHTNFLHDLKLSAVV